MVGCRRYPTARLQAAEAGGRTAAVGGCVRLALGFSAAIRWSYVTMIASTKTD